MLEITGHDVQAIVGKVLAVSDEILVELSMSVMQETAQSVLLREPFFTVARNSGALV